MNANYKNWVPNGMIAALTTGTAVFGAGTIALMCSDIDPKLRKILVGTDGCNGYKDYLFHFKGFLIGCVYTTIIALLFSGIDYVLLHYCFGRV